MTHAFVLMVKNKKKFGSDGSVVLLGYGAAINTIN